MSDFSLETLTRVRIAEVKLTPSWVVLVVGTENPCQRKLPYARVSEVLVYLIQHEGPASNYNKLVIERILKEERPVASTAVN